MRSIGAASKALDVMIQRVTDPSRKTFGKFLYEHGQYTHLPVTLRAQQICTQEPLWRKLRSREQKSRPLVFLC